MKQVEFSDWITKKYVEWRGDAIGNDRSITEFAKHIGVSQSLMSHWMKKGGKKPRSAASINALIHNFGDEVYEVLGLKKPIQYSPLESVPREIRERIELAAGEIEEELERRGITGEMPEAVEISTKIMEKYGFIYIRTETEPD